MIKEMDPDKYAYVLEIMTAITFVFQIYLIYLINYKTPSSTTQYCYFLYLFVIADFTFTFLLDVGMAPDAVDGIFGSTMKALGKYLPPNGQRALISATVYMGGMVIMYQDYCLIYRFTVIFGRSLHRYFMSRTSKIIFNLFWHSIGLGLGFLCYSSVMDEKTLYIRIKEEEADFQRINGGHFFIWFDFKSNWTLAFAFIMLFSFLLSESISVGCVWVILRMLKKNSASYSKNTYRLHRQFTILLAVQLTLPVLLILLPVAIALVLGLLGVSLSNFSTQIGFAIFSSYAFLNSMLTIMFITPYREDFKDKIRLLYLDRIFCCKERFANKTPVSQVLSYASNAGSINPQTPRNAEQRSPNTAPIEAFR
ncbi:hypothetical protein M3Y97_00953000 [Aphelenchoides bicaudatus]|nr:hypothetical protein M3Y97_00953000 [Aphelenchoides bicaudatus]